MTKDELFYKQKNIYDIVSEAEAEQIYSFAEGYKKYMSASKTERQAVREAIKLAEEKGFKPYIFGSKLKAGDRVYFDNRGKALMLAVIGSEPLSRGINLAAAHVDSPRLDLKQVPLYEEAEMAFLKTHYYGGIKKYQWLAIPLELHGVVVKKDGSRLDVSIGDKPGEPQFVITDLLPHLGADQLKKNAGDFVPGESLNILFGSRPDKEEGEGKVKLTVMKLLNEKYGLIEEDFLSAELSAVPAFEVRDIGFDKSLIGAYGHDDRVCVYSELMAIFEAVSPKKTAVCLLVDKEEIGSEGVSGMLAQSFDRFMESLCSMQGANLYECYANSFCLSADVCNAFDPNYPEVSEKRNNAKVNYGVAIMKYTGSKGKSGSNDASAEVMGRVRQIFAAGNVIWQTGELGKVDQGGGGTVAKYTAKRDIDTIDAGVPVLSMHAPFEVISKADLYMTYKGVLALYNDK
jgi:aspartyl aminopeptidase